MFRLKFALWWIATRLVVAWALANLWIRRNVLPPELVVGGFIVLLLTAFGMFYLDIGEGDEYWSPWKWWKDP
jgi:fatty acid desaturase